MAKTLRGKTHLIVNRGPNTLLSLLGSGLKHTQRADIAVAFVSLAGIEKVLAKLRTVAKRSGARLVFGLYQDVTQPAALERLLRASEETNGLFSVRISRNHCFHAKMYLLASPDRISAFVGSSNLTREGLSSDGELNLSLSATSATAKVLAEQFDVILSDTVPLTEGLIDRYAGRYDLIQKRGKPKGLPTLSGILKVPAADEEDEGLRENPSLPRHWWRDTIRSYAAPKTEQIIGNETDWDAKGWQWHSAGPHHFERGDTILLLDFTVRRVYLARVADKTVCSTPDGRYFVAWKRLKQFRSRRMTDGFWSEMKAHGLVESKRPAGNQRRLLGKVLQNAAARVFRKA